MLLKAVTNTCHDDSGDPGWFTHGHHAELKEVFDYLVSQEVMEEDQHIDSYYKVVPEWREFVAWLYK